jgi:hypothetical protein
MPDLSFAKPLCVVTYTGCFFGGVAVWKQLRLGRDLTHGTLAAFSSVCLLGYDAVSWDPSQSCGYRAERLGHPGPR